MMKDTEDIKSGYRQPQCESPTKDHKVLWNGPLLDAILTVFLSHDTTPGHNGGQRVLYVLKSYNILEQGHGYIALYNPLSLPEFIGLVQQQYLAVVMAEKKAEAEYGNSVCH